MAQEDRGVGIEFGLGLLAGAAIGIGLGLLFAPKEGAALRRDISRRAREWQDEAADSSSAPGKRPTSWRREARTSRIGHEVRWRQA